MDKEAVRVDVAMVNVAMVGEAREPMAMVREAMAMEAEPMEVDGGRGDGGGKLAAMEEGRRHHPHRRPVWHCEHRVVTASASTQPS